jgi:Ca2+-transporting ATPase
MAKNIGSTNPIEDIIWHSKNVDETFSILETTPKGLTKSEVDERLEKYGKNELIAEDQLSPILLFIGQFKSLLIIILVLAAIISYSIGEIVEAIAIIIIVILAGVLGFIQEYRAGKAIESLKKMAAPLAHVKRDGEDKEIASSDLVPGDIIVLKTGDKIPADARIIESSNLRIEEASLTGESLAVEKSIEKLAAADVTLGDRKNMVYMGTAISYGRGKAVVVHTGMKTEFGKIAGLLQSTENRKTPIQINLDQLGKKLGIFSILLAASMGLLGVLRGYDLFHMFVWGVAVAVAVIPEALPAVVTISLALGVRRMVKRRALIRKLPAVETLGATDIICSDKTGTLTQDQMTIRKIYTDEKLFDLSGSGYNPSGEFLIDSVKTVPLENQSLMMLLRGGSLCNDTKLKNDGNVWEILGDPTEGAIIVALNKTGEDWETLRTKYKRLYEIPFSSETKKMTTVHQFETEKLAFSKGAPEIILDKCTMILQNDKRVQLTEEIRKTVLSKAYAMGEAALRVLAVSFKSIDGDQINDSIAEDEHIFLGLVGMIDPPRNEVKAAIKICDAAGIKPIMITGDHKVTAVAVAKELGIMRSGNALSGPELEKLSDEEFEKAVDNTEVYARISPAHKLKIVDALMKKGHIVAMTGDGVNDAPSLKKADIGVAMGITGTDVSKEAADMILTDDNFASIVSAVEEGRSIFENIRKYLVFLLSGNMGTVFALIATLLIGLPIPLYAVQILFINFIMDGLIAIALGVEPPEPGIMNKPPRKVGEGILNKVALMYIGGVGAWISVVTLGVFIWALNYGYSESEAITLFFATLIAARLFNGYNCRSLEQSTFKLSLFSNKAILLGSLFSIAMTFAVIYLPVLNIPFKTVPLDLFKWIIVFAASFSVLLLVEATKFFIRKGKLNFLRVS